ncbi:MAG TPA: SH3 domain-containing C40 family peptidase [Cytophagaceae bacterium]
MIDIADNFGICALSIVPVRAEAAQQGEIINQLLFGDVYTVLRFSEDHKWINISSAFDDYKGWIEVKQHRPVNRSYFETVKSSNFPVCKDLIGLVRGKNRFFPIVFGSTLPYYESGFIMLGDEQYIFEGKAGLIEKSSYKVIEAIARHYLSAPYLWGGKTHFGIDCSGFVQQVFRLSGYSLPRDSMHQAEAGTEVSIQELIPGDLAFFKNAHGNIIHVGIAMEHRQIIHASGEVRIDLLDDKGIFNESTNSYTHRLASVRRILK